MSPRTRLLAAAALTALAAALAPSATAKVSPEEAARLDKDLTPIGSERAGNADGTIPEWTGGITTPPAGWTPGTHHKDPFAGETPRFTIDGSNYQQYAANLTEGQKAMFATYGQTFKMPVYPTHRSCNLPEKAYEWNRKNATTAELVAGGSGVRNAFYAVPFPIPQSGQEVIWNHLLRFRGFTFNREYTSMPVQSNGSFTKVRANDEGVFRWSDPNKSGVEDLNNISIYFITYIVSPPRLAGTATLVHETIDQTIQNRQVWQYSPGTRRVRRAPDIAYDNPATGSDGMSTSDALNMFNGAIDRYDWNLVGKKEIYIPYNAYRLGSPDTTFESLITPKHMNPEYKRYELHRVWVVDATLKDGARHIYSRRTFYIDEDSWFIVAADLYDGQGRLWRAQEGHLINTYQLPGCNEVATAVYDIQSQTYFVDALVNETKPIAFDSGDVNLDRYQPANLRQIGVR